MAKGAIRLVETRRDCALAEKQPPYDILLTGVFYGQLYVNMRGYVGYVPTPQGLPCNLGEVSISIYRTEVSRLNREFAKSASLS